ncbi:MAG TPA: CAP domain-containing protein, partial [Allosphingosinicella sp.]
MACYADREGLDCASLVDAARSGLARIGDGRADADEGQNYDLAGPSLAAHNSERAQFGAPPLQWDPGLAAAAEGYAQVLAAGAPFVHSPRTG